MNHRPTSDTDRVDVSVVVPSHNEQDNVLPLLEQFAELAQRARFRLEVVWVDDGSTDQTLPRVVDAQAQHRFLRVVSLPHRRGLTEALRAGFGVSRGDILVFYPADRQFHPADIPRMVEKVRAGYDLVTGRKIGQYSKRFVSSFYNRLSRWLFPAIPVSDLNSVKAFRRELVSVLDYRHDWHRFWVAIVAEAGYRVGEVDVTLYRRGAGRSKFGFWRIPGGVLDLLAVKFQYHTMRRPLWYFGMTGLLLLAAAFVVGLVAVVQRLQGHGHRPLIYLVMTLGISGIVFFAMGFLAESVAGVRQQIDAMRPAPRLHTYRPGSRPQVSARPGSADRRGVDMMDRQRERRGPDSRQHRLPGDRDARPASKVQPARRGRRQVESTERAGVPTDRRPGGSEPLARADVEVSAPEVTPGPDAGDLFIPPTDWADSGWREGADEPPRRPTPPPEIPEHRVTERGSASSTSDLPGGTPPANDLSKDMPSRSPYGRRNRP
ncbi:MAG: glycosyltransferase family 2 protein [Candidatus Zixiibacteriota bacterium]